MLTPKREEEIRKAMKWIAYTISIDGKVAEQMYARSPKDALKLIGFSYADTHSYTFLASTVVVASSKRQHTFTHVEYYCDDDSLYFEDVRIA